MCLSICLSNYLPNYLSNYLLNYLPNYLPNYLSNCWTYVVTCLGMLSGVTVQRWRGVWPEVA